MLGFGLLLLIALGAGLLALASQLASGLPSVDRLGQYDPPVATRVLAADGTVLAEFFIEQRYVQPIYRIPRVVQLAFVAAEDASFYEHGGIDWASVVRAAVENYRAGTTRQGGSTITQQVVKALLLTPERSYERKLKEMYLALQLEHRLTKDEILYLYLNQIYLGSGAYGVQAAARNYFGKNVSDLTLAEAALLAGLPQAPSRYSPRRHMERARARQRYVLRQMVKAGFITRAQAAAAEREKIELAPRPPADTAGPAPYFVEHVRRYLVKRYGGTAAYKLGLDVHTTLDPVAQAAAERALRDGIRAIDERQGFRGPLRKLEPAVWRAALDATQGRPAAPLPAPGSTLDVVVLPESDGQVGDSRGTVRVLWAGGVARIDAAGLRWAKRKGYEPRAGDVLREVVREHETRRKLALAHENGTQAALIAMRPATGDVVAMVGGLDWEESEFNRATQALRQPGSAFKPLIYTAAFDRGFTPTTVIDDSPVHYRIGPGRTWSPKNFSKRFHGPTTLREALTKSRNVVTVKLTDAMGLNYLRSYLPRFGLSRPIPRNLSIALGTAEVTLLELVEAYGVFANLGTRVEPRFITRITDREGRRLEEIPVRSTPVISPETAYLTVSLMRSVVEQGTGRRARLDRPAAGKTGTTNDLRDAWFVGYTPDLLAGVWVGYDQDRTLGRHETGGRAAAPIWKEFMEAVLTEEPVRDFPVPPEVVLVSVDPKSGRRTPPGAPGSRLEAYRRGTEPTPPVAVEAHTPYFGNIWDRDPRTSRPVDPPDRARADIGAADRGSGDDLAYTRRWGDGRPADPAVRRWGDRPPPDPGRRRWGDARADPALPGWARLPEAATQGGGDGRHTETNRWSRSLNTRSWPSSPAPDPAARAGPPDPGGHL